MASGGGSLFWWLSSIGAALLAAMVGHFYNSIVELVRFRWRRIFEPVSAIEHVWFEYHWTMHHRVVVLAKGKMTRTKSGGVAPYHVELEHNNINNTTYSGTATRENGHILMTLSSRQGKPETLTYRFPEPIGKKIENLHGLWLSYNYDEYIATGASILTKQEIPDANISDEIAKGIELVAGKPLMEVKK